MEEKLACDKKKAAQVYMMANAAPECMFSQMDVVTKNYGKELGGMCLMHTRKRKMHRAVCKVGSGVGLAEVMVIGFSLCTILAAARQVDARVFALRSRELPCTSRLGAGLPFVFPQPHVVAKLSKTLSSRESSVFVAGRSQSLSTDLTCLSRTCSQDPCDFAVCRFNKDT